MGRIGVSFGYLFVFRLCCGVLVVVGCCLCLCSFVELFTLACGFLCLLKLTRFLFVVYVTVGLCVLLVYCVDLGILFLLCCLLRELFVCGVLCYFINLVLVRGV